MKRWFFRGLLAVIGLVVLGVAVVLIAGGEKLRAFPSMPAAYEAKEFCSCLFVSGRSEAFCEEYIHQDVVPIQSRVVDHGARTVTGRALWQTAVARHQPGRGCVLDR